jgi:hypothetical protein
MVKGNEYRILQAGEDFAFLDSFCRMENLSLIKEENVQKLAALLADSEYIFACFHVADSAGLDRALKICAMYELPVLLVCSAQMLEHARYMSKDADAFCIRLPLQEDLALQAYSFMLKAGCGRMRLVQQLEKEKQKRQEEQMVARCKLQLIEQLHWSEQKAHDYIIQNAMSHNASKIRIARAIMRKLDAAKTV